jgi:hypothetical protein
MGTLRTKAAARQAAAAARLVATAPSEGQAKRESTLSCAVWWQMGCCCVLKGLGKDQGNKCQTAGL